jgi:hypothetical protein
MVPNAFNGILFMTSKSLLQVKELLLTLNLVKQVKKRLVIMIMLITESVWQKHLVH